MTQRNGPLVPDEPPLPWPAELRSVPGWTVRRSREHVAETVRSTWTVVRAIAASTLDVPQLEFKLAAGRQLFELVEAAADGETRLAELGVHQAPRTPTMADAHRLSHTLALAPATDRILAIHGYWLPRLHGEFERAACAADSLLDGPTVRTLRRAAAELSSMLAWSTEAVSAAGSAGRLESVAGELHDAGSRPAPAPELNRPRSAARDGRYTTFDRTRDYRSAPDWRDADDEYTNTLVELLRVNRDEIDAIETFALALFDLVEELPVQALRHLGRLAWDEARHAATGHTILDECGEDGFSPACSMIGINLRAAMNGYDAWAQITLFGELGIIGPMRALARSARERGDHRTQSVFDFICSDEVMHLRDSRRWLEATHPAGGLEAVAETVRQLAARLLDEQGVLPTEHYLALSREEIFALVGE